MIPLLGVSEQLQGEHSLGGQAERVEDVNGRKRGRKEEFNIGRVSSSDAGEWQILVQLLRPLQDSARLFQGGTGIWE